LDFGALVEAARAVLDTELGELACTGSHAPAEDALGRLRDALASQPVESAEQPAADDGWRMVPVEPTPEMLNAGDAQRQSWGIKSPVHVGRRISADVYRAMLGAAPQAAPPDVTMPEHWSVAVNVDGGENLLTIGHDWVSGAREPTEEDRQTIIGAAQHLLAFVGYGLPPCNFDPDADEAPQAAGLLAKTHTGMKVDYRGLLGQSRRALGRTEGGYAEMLRQLEGHLTELGQRWYAGDTAVVDEILQLYCIEKDARALAQKNNLQLRNGGE